MPTQPAHTSSSSLLKKVTRTIREQRLFDHGQHLLVAVSGGPDSIGLLSLLIRLASSWNLRLTAAHINYRLRGSESDEDEAFVRAFCEARQIPLLVLRPVLLRQRRCSSLQEMARMARYEALKKVAKDIGADRICLGHTANDQAETILMWMLRGAGLTGLVGMPFVREEIIVRPLLSSARVDVLTFLRQEGLSYREDSSNATDWYHRNRIRMDLWPAVTRIAPAAMTILQRQADLLREDERYLDQVAREQWASLVDLGEEGVQRLERGGFVSLPIALQRRVIRLLLRVYETKGRSAGFKVVESVRRFMVAGKEGARVRLRNVILRREGGTIVCDRKVANQAGAAATPVMNQVMLPVSFPSTVYWAGSGIRFQVQLLSREEAEPLLQQRSTQGAIFDADCFSFPLILRDWRPGDRFRPCGMRGKSKKLQDFFTDLKIARHKRAAFPVLAAPEGILWVAGLRQDERFVVRGSSRRCLVVTMDQESREGAP